MSSLRCTVYVYVCRPDVETTSTQTYTCNYNITTRLACLPSYYITTETQTYIIYYIIIPDPSVSNKLNASLISSISSSERPGLSYVLAPLFGVLRDIVCVYVFFFLKKERREGKRRSEERRLKKKWFKQKKRGDDIKKIKKEKKKSLFSSQRAINPTTLPHMISLTFHPLLIQ